MRKPFIIAEIGSSPAPAWDFAQWCEGARAVGADAIKAQIFYAEHFPRAEQASKRALEFPRERLREFVNTAHAYGLQAGASVFDKESVILVARECDFIKLAARESKNTELINSVVRFRPPREIHVYRSISYFSDHHIAPEFITLFALQSYPSGMVWSVFALLKAAAFFKSRGARWGWSSHTTGTLDCVMASRLGAEVIEKHFCLGASNIEAGHSLLPNQFADMVERIKS